MDKLAPSLFLSFLVVINLYSSPPPELFCEEPYIFHYGSKRVLNCEKQGFRLGVTKRAIIGFPLYVNSMGKKNLEKLFGKRGADKILMERKKSGEICLFSSDLLYHLVGNLIEQYKGQIKCKKKDPKHDSE
jgi:hypothetical protein